LSVYETPFIITVQVSFDCKVWAAQLLGEVTPFPAVLGIPSPYLQHHWN